MLYRLMAFRLLEEQVLCEWDWTSWRTPLEHRWCTSPNQHGVRLCCIAEWQDHNCFSYYILVTQCWERKRTLLLIWTGGRGLSLYLSISIYVYQDAHIIILGNMSMIWTAFGRKFLLEKDFILRQSKPIPKNDSVRFVNNFTRKT